MLIDLSEMIKEYELNIIGIIHIGAHDAEEDDSYTKNGIKNVVWIEANPDIASRLSNSSPHLKVINELVSDKDGEEVIFHITNNGQSSSILELGTHRDLFPGITIVKDINLISKTLNTIVKDENIDMMKHNFLNIDIQGAELMALRGSYSILPYIDSIYTEINTDYVYKKCALVGEIDEYLGKFGFKRVATKMWADHPWGDALYKRIK